MKEIIFDSIQAFNDYYEKETRHPLVTVMRYDKVHKLEESVFKYGLYALFLKENKGC